MPVPSPKKTLSKINWALRLRESQDAEMNLLWSEFGAGVRERREHLKLSLEELAASMGIGKSMLSYLETGGREWSVGLARRAVKELGL